MSEYEMKLPPNLVENVLDKLRFSKYPDVNLSGLTEIYQAWCSKVPFDNIRKRIDSSSVPVLPLPGFTPTDFFTYWLKFGTGGTCWASHGALYALLDCLGFSVQYGLSTMLSQSPAPANSPGHGTLIVNVEDKPFIVDATMFHGHPLPLKEGLMTHPVWGTRIHRNKGYWYINWKPLGRSHLDCQLLEMNAPAHEYPYRHEQSRNASRFDGALLIRMAGFNEITGVVKGKKIVRRPNGDEIISVLSKDEKSKLLIEQFCIAEEIVFRIPDDIV